MPTETVSYEEFAFGLQQAYGQRLKENKRNTAARRNQPKPDLLEKLARVNAYLDGDFERDVDEEESIGDAIAEAEASVRRALLTSAEAPRVTTTALADERLQDELQETRKLAAAAVTLQAAVRGRLARVEASHVRAELENIRARQAFARNVAATNLQAAVRGRLARNEASILRAEIATLKARECAAVTVQAAVRGRLARVEANHMRAETAMLKALRSAAAVTIQSTFRGHLIRMKTKSIRKTNALKEAACVRIQAAFCGLLDRRRVKMERAKMAQASTLLQSAARGFLVRRLLTRQRNAAHQIQALVRGHVARIEVARMRAEIAGLRETSAISIQAAVRRRKAQLEAARMRAELTQAVLSIQAAVRRRKAQLEAARMRAELAGLRETSAVSIQAAMRGRLARLELSRMRQAEAAAARKSAAVQLAVRSRLPRVEASRAPPPVERAVGVVRELAAIRVPRMASRSAAPRGRNATSTAQPQLRLRPPTAARFDAVPAAQWAPHWNTRVTSARTRSGLPRVVARAYERAVHVQHQQELMVGSVALGARIHSARGRTL